MEKIASYFKRFKCWGVPQEFTALIPCFLLMRLDFQCLHYLRQIQYITVHEVSLGVSVAVQVT
jgi:hypothetical protein